MIREAIVSQADDGLFFYPPKYSDYPGMDMVGWEELTRAQGYEIEENTEIDGRIRQQGAGKVFRCSLTEYDFVNVIVWDLKGRKFPGRRQTEQASLEI